MKSSSICSTCRDVAGYSILQNGGQKTEQIEKNRFFDLIPELL
jgi:hypothetical protein